MICVNLRFDLRTFARGFINYFDTLKLDEDILAG